jgi:hypothetical protein
MGVIPYRKRTGEIEMKFPSCLQDKIRVWLDALAALVPAVGAVIDPGNGHPFLGKGLHNMPIDALHILMAENSKPDARLVRYNKEEIAIFDSPKGREGIRVKNDIRQGSKISSIFDERSVPVQKDCRPAR